jgi:hypothetical protein
LDIDGITGLCAGDVVTITVGAPDHTHDANGNPLAGHKPTKVGTAYIDVEPDLSDFEHKLEVSLAAALNRIAMKVLKSND